MIFPASLLTRATMLELNKRFSLKNIHVMFEEKLNFFPTILFFPSVECNFSVCTTYRTLKARASLEIQQFNIVLNVSNVRFQKKEKQNVACIMQIWKNGLHNKKHILKIFRSKFSAGEILNVYYFCRDERGNIFLRQNIVDFACEELILKDYQEHRLFLIYFGVKMVQFF